MTTALIALMVLATNSDLTITDGAPAPYEPEHLDYTSSIPELEIGIRGSDRNRSNYLTQVALTSPSESDPTPLIDPGFEEIFASMSPFTGAAATAPIVPLENGGFMLGEGEFPAGGSGNSSTPSIGNSDGVKANVNTNTGHLTAVLPLVSWDFRGDLGLDFHLVHSTQDSAFDWGAINRGQFGQSWKHSYDIRIRDARSIPGVRGIRVLLPDNREVRYNLGSDTGVLMTTPRHDETLQFKQFNEGGSLKVFLVMTLANGSKLYFRPLSNMIQNFVAPATGQENEYRLVRIADGFHNGFNVVEVGPTQTIIEEDIPASPGSSARRLILTKNATTNNITQVMDPAGRIISFGYNSEGRLAQVSYPSVQRRNLLTGSVSTQTLARLFQYDSQANLILETDPSGKQWTWNYNVNQALISVGRPGKDLIYYSLAHGAGTPNAGVSTMTTSMRVVSGGANVIQNGIHRHTYLNGLLSADTDPNEGTMRYVYNSFGNISEV